jgi:hypothetical protein
MLNINTVITDEGFLFESTKEDKYIEMIELQTDFQDNPGTPYQMAGFYIYANNRLVETTRRYIKLPEIIAGVGGLLKGFTTVFQMFNFFFTQTNKIFKIINKIYLVDEDFTNEMTQSNKMRGGINTYEISGIKNKTSIELSYG